LQVRQNHHLAARDLRVDVCLNILSSQVTEDGENPTQFIVSAARAIEIKRKLLGLGLITGHDKLVDNELMMSPNRGVIGGIWA
jgi:hypothetical protein